MFKRIGLGMIFILFSALTTLSVDVYGHMYHSPDATCNLTNEDTFVVVTLNISLHVLIIQSFLNAIGHMFLYISTYEFICSQSPHVMKGLLIGTALLSKESFS